MAEPAMDEAIDLETELLPCGICGRTFVPASLAKHSRVCERNATRKRKVFDSLKQRVEGTDLALFHQKRYLKKQELLISQPETKQNNWKQKHIELVNAIRAAKGVNVTMSPIQKRSSSSVINVGNERCPSCDRHFGPKAYDRHVEWCKERKSRIQNSPVNMLAKERLEARTKYRVPPLNKSKRLTTKEKYSPTMSRTETIPMNVNVAKSAAAIGLERTPSIRKPKSTVNLSKNAREHGNLVKKDKMENSRKGVEKNVSKHIKETPEDNNLHSSRTILLPKINTTDVNKDIEELTVLKLRSSSNSALENNELIKLVTWKDTIKPPITSKIELTLKKNKNEMSKLHKLNVINLDTDTFKSNSCVYLDDIGGEGNLETPRSNILNGSKNKIKKLEDYFINDMMRKKQKVNKNDKHDKLPAKHDVKVMIVDNRCNGNVTIDQEINREFGEDDGRINKKNCKKNRVKNLETNVIATGVQYKKVNRVKKDIKIIELPQNRTQDFVKNTETDCSRVTEKQFESLRNFDEDSLDSDSSRKEIDKTLRTGLLSNDPLIFKNEHEILQTHNVRMLEETKNLLKNKNKSSLKFEFNSPATSRSDTIKQSCFVPKTCQESESTEEEKLLYKKLTIDICELESLDGMIVNKHNDALSTARTQFYGNVRKCHSDICLKKKFDANLLTSTELDLSKFQYSYGDYFNKEVDEFSTKVQLLDEGAGDFLEFFKCQRDGVGNNLIPTTNFYSPVFIDCAPRKKRRLNDNTEERIYVKDEFSHEYILDKEIDINFESTNKSSPNIENKFNANGDNGMSDVNVIPLGKMINLLGICEKPTSLIPTCTYLPVIEEVSSEGVSVQDSTSVVKKISNTSKMKISELNNDLSKVSINKQINECINLNNGLKNPPEKKYVEDIICFRAMTENSSSSEDNSESLDDINRNTLHGNIAYFKHVENDQVSECENGTPSISQQFSKESGVQNASKTTITKNISPHFLTDVKSVQKHVTIKESDISLDASTSKQQQAENDKKAQGCKESSMDCTVSNIEDQESNDDIQNRITLKIKRVKIRDTKRKALRKKKSRHLSVTGFDKTVDLYFPALKTDDHKTSPTDQESKIIIENDVSNNLTKNEIDDSGESNEDTAVIIPSKNKLPLSPRTFKLLCNVFNEDSHKTEVKPMQVTPSQVINLLKLNYKKIAKLVEMNTFKLPQISPSQNTMETTNQKTSDLKLPDIFESGVSISKNNTNTSLNISSKDKRNNQKDVIPITEPKLGITQECEMKSENQMSENFTSYNFVASLTNLDYNPFISAERQLMELLECDDFKPFKTITQPLPARPQTTDNTSQRPKSPINKNKNKKITKSADKSHKINLTKITPKGKRASVIDPPSDFQDNSVNINDSFELLENYINKTFGDTNLMNDVEFENFFNSNKKEINGFFTENKENGNYSLRTILNDDNSIDPRLINENDNLTIPENFKSSNSSPISDNNEVDHYSVQYDKKISALESEILPKPNTYKKLNYINDNHLETEEYDELISSLDDLENFTKKQLNKTDKKSIKSTQKSTKSLNSSVGNNNNDKKKNLSSLKRSISLLDPVLKPRSLKSKKDVEHYFEEQEHRNHKKEPVKKQASVLDELLTSPPKAEELFCVDDEMYEEYKKYEQMYLKEKEEKMKKEERKINETPSEDDESLQHASTKLSGDSAYGSLNRKSPKIRSRAHKLSPLGIKKNLPERVESPTSSSSSESSPALSSLTPTSKLRMSKFCHECGSKYPVSTAKFCVECGVKRLLL